MQTEPKLWSVGEEIVADTGWVKIYDGTCAIWKHVPTCNASGNTNEKQFLYHSETLRMEKNISVA